MKVKDVMTKTPACCSPNTPLQEVARLMVTNDCGSIPVVENETTMRLVGIVTDRDITCRAVAEGRNPEDLTAEDCMSTSVATVTPEASLSKCCTVMEERQVRRVPVVDKALACCGVISQADIALHSTERQIAGVMSEVSQPNGSA